MSPTHSRHLNSLPRGPLCGRMPRASSPVPLDVSPASDAVYLVSLQTLPLISQAPSWFRWPVPPPALGLLGSNHSRCPFPESQGSGRVPTLPPAFIPLLSSRWIYVPPTGYCTSQGLGPQIQRVQPKSSSFHFFSLFSSLSPSSVACIALRPLSATWGLFLTSPSPPPRIQLAGPANPNTSPPDP